MASDSSAPRASIVLPGAAAIAPDAASVSPRASIVVPTRERLDYLRVALASIAPQAAKAGAELIVVDDAGPSEQGRRLAERFGARYEPHPRALGLNVARNTGVERSRGELVVFVDDDVEVRDGWLEALLEAAREQPAVDVFTGPIVPLLEGSPPRGCGREGAPITALDLGPENTPTRFAWGANMAIRRAALERVGPFDVSLEHGGDEQEWQERLYAEHAARTRSSACSPDDGPAGGTSGGTARHPVRYADAAPRAGSEPATREDGAGHPVLYVAAAKLYHRRSAADARLAALCRAALARGKAARRFDAWRGLAPSLARESLTLAGCCAHVIRRRCPAGLTMVGHSGGRLLEALRETAFRETPPLRAREGSALESTLESSTGNLGEAHHPEEDFLSGESGTIGGLDALRRRVLDAVADAFQVASGERARLDRAARRQPSRRRVLVLCVQRPVRRALVEAIRGELARSRHAVTFHSREPGGLGKFENLNMLLASYPPHDADWLLVLDDDIVLPRGFLDRFLFLAERFRLDLAQPAHQLASHAAWRVTRRRPGSAVRETCFVEIGPVTAFRHSTFSTLLPFPELRMGWGLDMHWAALAREHDWRCGVIDATPIVHRAAPAASGYSREQALAEARSFLEHRAYLRASEARQTLVTHRRW
jgi:GT2 family glycosyltransferase